MIRKTLLSLLIVYSSGLYAGCEGCSRGEFLSGLTSGSSSSTGISGSFVLDHLYDFNTSTIALTLGEGVPIPFNQPPLIAGTGVTKTDDTTFTFTKTGDYYVTFAGSTALVSLLGGVNFNLNGVPEGVTSSLALAGTPLILQQIISVTTVPSTLQVVINALIGVSVTLTAGTSATLSIIELSTP